MDQPTHNRRVSKTAIEDYLKTIFLLAKVESPVSTSRIADDRNVKPASVSGMLVRLSNDGYVNYQKHRGVSLTGAGNAIALEMLRHHRLIELYLTQELGFGWDEVHEQAEVLEHYISEKLEERIADVLDNPKVGLYGAPIPAHDGTIEQLDAIPLATLPLGTRARIARIVNDRDSALLRYLDSIDIAIGVEICVLDVAPHDGPLTILLSQEQRIIGHKIATLIQVIKFEEI